MRHIGAYVFENRDPADGAVKLPARRRSGQFSPASFDAAERTIDVVWSTGAVVRRSSAQTGEYDEQLIVSPDAVRLDRLNAGAPFLKIHNDRALANVLGAVVPGSARIENGRGLASVRLSAARDVAPIAARIIEGTLRNVSVGYAYHRVEKVERDGQVPLWRVVDWEPLEISAVPIPADPGAQVRSARDREIHPCTVTWADEQ
jgi:phage head maturation protease